MSYFIIYTTDRPDSLAIRQDNRAAHLDWLRSEPAVALHIAGPWLNDDGEMAGSLLIVSAEDLHTVNSWLAHDPYVLAGLTGLCEVKPYNWVVGAPS